MIEPLDEAVKVWDDPIEMIEQWDASESKAKQDRLIAQMVGHAEKVADLGCGSGRLVPFLSVDQYFGYDTSSKMLWVAILKHGRRARFSLWDVFASAPKEVFDVVVLYDVAVHQKDPLAAVRRVLEIWKAERYICTLLVGPGREDLFASVVVSSEEFSQFLGDLTGQRWQVQPHRQKLEPEKFEWVVLDVSR